MAGIEDVAYIADDEFVASHDEVTHRRGYGFDAVTIECVRERCAAQPRVGDHPAKVLADIDLLKDVSRRVCDWVNDYVAHARYDDDPAKQVARDRNVPKYQELDDAFAAIEAVALKYARIFLKHDRLPYDVAEIGADEWLSIFDFPWKPQGKAQRALTRRPDAR